MPIVSILFGLVVIGVILYVVNSVVPMDARFRTVINAIVILVVIGWLLSAFGFMHCGTLRIT